MDPTGIVHEAEQISKVRLIQENKALQHRIAELEAKIVDLEHRLAQVGMAIQQGGLRGKEVK